MRLCNLIMDGAPEGVEYDLLDLAVRHGTPPVRPCKACVSTAGPHCHWPCSCYGPAAEELPDYLWDEDVYGRLVECHGLLVVTPINWYSVPTQLKAMFDRLVCANGGNPYPELTDYKDRDMSRRLEVLPEWQLLSRNHLGGRTAAFLVYGDGGANEAGPGGLPRMMDPRDAPWYRGAVETAAARPGAAILPLVAQLQYSGLHVGAEDVLELTFGEGVPYGINNVTFGDQDGVMGRALEFADGFAARTAASGPRTMPAEEAERDAEWLDVPALKARIASTRYPSG